MPSLNWKEEGGGEVDSELTVVYHKGEVVLFDRNGEVRIQPEEFRTIIAWLIKQESSELFGIEYQPPAPITQEDIEEVYERNKAGDYSGGVVVRTDGDRPKLVTETILQEVSFENSTVDLGFRKESLGVTYVDLTRFADRQRVIDYQNVEALCGKRIRITYETVDADE